MQNLKYIDTHSHIHFEDFDNDRKEMSDRMSDSNVGTIVVATGLATSLSGIKYAVENKDVWACIGIFPRERESFSAISSRVNSGKIDMSKVVAVGECGLDYFRLNDINSNNAINKSDNNSSIVPWCHIEKKEKDRQKDLFKEQIEFAIKYKLPLMLHIRSSNDKHGQSTNDAHNDALEILTEYKKVCRKGGDSALKIHCHFTTFGIEMAKKFIALDKNITFGIPGVVTYKNGKELQELVNWLPLEKILSETDAPYAAPVPHRGKRNEPIFVIDIVNAIADLRNEDREIVRKQLLANAVRVFNLGIECLSR